jgi:hypothetical protein
MWVIINLGPLASIVTDGTGVGECKCPQSTFHPSYDSTKQQLKIKTRKQKNKDTKEVIK